MCIGKREGTKGYIGDTGKEQGNDEYPIRWPINTGFSCPIVLANNISN